MSKPFLATNRALARIGMAVHARRRIRRGSDAVARHRFKTRRAAVDDWLASDRFFHVMRDHPFHSRWPILAGMWGVRGSVLRNMPVLQKEKFPENPDAFKWGVDQVFLRQVIHPPGQTRHARSR